MFSCSFFASEDFKPNQDIGYAVKQTLLSLVQKRVWLFYFANDLFNRFCHEIVLELKKDFPQITDAFVRTEKGEQPDGEYDNDLFVHQTTTDGNPLKDVQTLLVEQSDFCLFYIDRSERQDNDLSSVMHYAQALEKKLIILEKN